MKYLGKDIKVLVVYPNVKEAIQKFSSDRNLKLISVTADLEFGQDEVNDLVKLMDAEMLSGRRANIYGMLDALREGMDIVWLITHAVPEGWFLSDGLVDASETTALIRSSGAFLTVMNTCSSESVAEAAAREIGSAFICTLKEVPDRKAFVTGVLLAQKLVAGYDYKQAFRQAKPGQNDSYRLIEARDFMAPSPVPDGRTPQQPSMDPGSFSAISKTLEDLDTIVNGSPRLGVPGLRGTLNTQNIQLTNIEARLSTIEKKVDLIDGIQTKVDGIGKMATIRTLMLWTFGLGFFVLSVAVVILILSLQSK